jgi:hypothetical protein
MKSEKYSIFTYALIHCLSPFGNLNLILSGDEYQLTGPRTIPLFNHNYVSLHKNNCQLQALNPGVRQKLTAIKNYWTIENCVVLDEVVRQ